MTLGVTVWCGLDHHQPPDDSCAIVDDGNLMETDLEVTQLPQQRSANFNVQSCPV